MKLKPGFEEIIPERQVKVLAAPLVESPWVGSCFATRFSVPPPTLTCEGMYHSFSSVGLSSQPTLGFVAQS